MTYRRIDIAVSAVQLCESGEGLEEISFNPRDSIVVQSSAENERIEGLSDNEKISWHHHPSSLTDIEVERDFGKNSIQWRKSHYSPDIYSRYEGMGMGLMRKTGFELKMNQYCDDDCDYSSRSWMW